MVLVLRSTLTASVLLCVTGAAMGQNALGDGHALDRNLQVGSGGRNTRSRDVNQAVRFNDAVITGNAAGGKSFHGYVGYRATDDFGGRIPSNDLYTFRRDSTQSALGGMGVRGSDALRYQFAAATGQALPSALAGGAGVPRSFSSSPTAVRSSASSSLRSTADYLASQAVRPTLVGYRADDSGAMYTATASPLLGVTWYPLQQDSGLAANLSANAPKTGDSTRAGSNTPKPIGLTGLESTAAGLPSPLDIAGREREHPVENPASASASSKVKSESYSKVLDAFRESYTQKTGAEKPVDAVAADDPSSPWRKDLDQLRDTLRNGNDRRARDGKPSEPDKAATPDGAKPKPDSPLPIPGMKPEDLIDPPKHPGPKAEDFLSRQMVEILRSGGVRIDTLRPTAPTLDQAAYAGHMQAGQQAIGEGRFFDAEDRFTRAMSAMPTDPMAAVGRVHAQIGAGLYLSAASNFRILMKDHPELAAAKYNAALIPGEARSKKIAEQLRIEISTGGTRLSRDASMLLGYLGRLRGDMEMQNEGLAEWKQRIPTDDTPELALHELLSKIWE